jgi:hypothetical protein
VVFVLAEVSHGLGPEPLEVRARRDARQVDLGGVAELVLEVGVDGVAPGLLHEPHEATDPQPGQFEHRQGHVDPPLVTSDVVEQRQLLRDRGDRLLAEQRGRDGLDLLAQPFGGDRIAVQLGELAAQHEHVEALGLLVVVLHR